MLTRVLGALVLAGGIALVFWGVARLLRPRRTADIEWERRHPWLSVLLGGIPGLIGFDRYGAAASIPAGALAIMLGAAALLSD